jgi:hypothetical protein
VVNLERGQSKETKEKIVQPHVRVPGF